MGEDDVFMLHLEELFVGGFSSIWIISAHHCQNQASEVSPILTFKQTFGGETEKNEKGDKKSFTTILAIAGRITKAILLKWRGYLE